MAPVDLSMLKPLKDKYAWTRGFMKSSAPRLLRGVLYQSMNGMSNKELYTYLTKDIWSEMPENIRAFLEGYKPWELEWLTLDYVQETVMAMSPAMCSAILSSQTLQDSIKRNIEVIKEHLS